MILHMQQEAVMYEHPIEHVANYFFQITERKF